MPALGLFGGASARALGWGIFSAVASGGGPTPTPPPTPTGVINVDLSTITGVGFFDLPTSFPTLMLGMTFRPDGTRMYASDFGGSNLIYQYNISTPWNLSTLSFSGTFNPSRGGISDIAFNGTGTHLYVIDRSGENCIMQYFCSTPWDITTASFIANSNLTLENIDCLFVSADGLNFIVGSQVTSFQRWSSSSPNVITSLSRTVGFSHGLSVLGMGMDPAGTFIYYPEFNASGNFYKRQLSTPWDVSTAGTATSRALPSSGSAFGSLDQVYIADDPKRIFIADYGSGGRRIHVFSYTSIGGGDGTTGQQAYTTPGTYSWVAPAGVTSVSVVAIGGFTESFFINASTVRGGGGSGSPGTFTGDGGGNGGSAGSASPNDPSGWWAGGGGGGAGGYTSNGGNGGNGVGNSGLTGHSRGAAGGGTGIFGGALGGSGGAGGVGTTSPSVGGAGGSSGTAGTSDGGGGTGGNYGGGAGFLTSSGASHGGGLGWKNNIAVTPGTAYTVVVGGTGTDTNAGVHAGGAVRIIWGAGRAFPSTNTGDGGGSPPPPSTSLTDYSNIISAGATAFSYISIPGGSRTLLNYLQSFGVNGNSSNDASSQWNNSFSGNISYAASPITNNNYFTQFNRVRVIDGDGSADGPDWAVFNFGTANSNGDFDGSADSNAHFGGETSYSGGTGGTGRTTGQIWGYNSSTGWTLLYQLPLGSGSGSSFTHSAGNWFSSGGTVTSGNGKRTAFDSTAITHLGFVVL